MPSQSTRVRLAPLGPIPRSETPVVVGCEIRLELRRKSPNPGTRPSVSSTSAAGDSESAALSREVTSATASTMDSSARLAVTTTVSVWDAPGPVSSVSCASSCASARSGSSAGTAADTAATVPNAKVSAGSRGREVHFGR